MATQGDDGHFTHLAPRRFSLPILARSSLGYEENLAALGAPREAAQYGVNLAGKATQNTDLIERRRLPSFQAAAELLCIHTIARSSSCRVPIQTTCPPPFLLPLPKDNLSSSI